MPPRFLSRRCAWIRRWRRLIEGAVDVKNKRVYLGLSDGAVELLEVKPDGKRAMAASAWAAGLQGADLSWGVLS